MFKFQKPKAKAQSIKLNSLKTNFKKPSDNQSWRKKDHWIYSGNPTSITRRLLKKKDDNIKS